MRLSLIGVAVGLLGAGAAEAQAQHRSTVLRIAVTDSIGRPIQGAEVTASIGLTTTLGSVVTDETGRRLLPVVWQDDRDYELSTRRLGFLKSTQFFRPTGDTMDLVIRMRPAPQMLQAVVVTPEESLRRKRFFIDADQIAASEHPVRNALDVVTKLRPDMIRPPGQTDCGLYYVWINGKRIVFPPIKQSLEVSSGVQRRAVAAGSRSRGGGSALRPSGQAAINLTVQSVLHSIRPEHIEEMNFVDCWDRELKRARAEGGLFVVLKEGIGFRSGRGSYVAFDTSEAVVK